MSTIKMSYLQFDEKLRTLGDSMSGESGKPLPDIASCARHRLVMQLFSFAIEVHIFCLVTF